MKGSSRRVITLEMDKDEAMALLYALQMVCTAAVEGREFISEGDMKVVETLMDTLGEQKEVGK